MASAFMTGGYQLPEDDRSWQAYGESSEKEEQFQRELKVFLDDSHAGAWMPLRRFPSEFKRMFNKAYPTDIYYDKEKALKLRDLVLRASQQGVCEFKENKTQDPAQKNTRIRSIPGSIGPHELSHDSSINALDSDSQRSALRGSYVPVASPNAAVSAFTTPADRRPCGYEVYPGGCKNPNCPYDHHISDLSTSERASVVNFLSGVTREVDHEKCYEYGIYFEELSVGTQEYYKEQWFGEYGVPDTGVAALFWDSYREKYFEEKRSRELDIQMKEQKEKYAFEELKLYRKISGLEDEMQEREDEIQKLKDENQKLKKKSANYDANMEAAKGIASKAAADSAAVMAAAAVELAALAK